MDMYGVLYAEDYDKLDRSYYQPAWFAGLMRIYCNDAREVRTSCCRTKMCYHCKMRLDIDDSHVCASQNISVEVRGCPKCHVPFVRTEGCSSIRCPCGHSFVYDKALMLGGPQRDASSGPQRDASSGPQSVASGLADFRERESFAAYSRERFDAYLSAAAYSRERRARHAAYLRARVRAGERHAEARLADYLMMVRDSDSDSDSG